MGREYLNMSTEKTIGLVIRQADFSETSKVITFFTRDWGKICVIAKGARRLKSAFESAIDLMAVCEIVFIRKSSGGLDLLTEAKLQQRFQPEGREMMRLYGGYYVVELLTGLTVDYDPHQELFDITVLTLEKLIKADNPQRTLIVYELNILREIGQLPALDICMQCDAELTSASGPFGYWMNQGGLICNQCRNREFQQQTLSAGTVALLQKLSASPSEQSDRLLLTPQQIQEIRYFTSSTIAHILGHRPKTLRYLSSF